MSGIQRFLWVGFEDKVGTTSPGTPRVVKAIGYLAQVSATVVVMCFSF